MKRCKITSLCAMLALAVTAANMEGNYNTWLGYLAGLNSSGTRTTLQGAGAGGEADELRHTDLIGAVAGVRSYGLEDCVGIGFAALAYSTNMNGVVAIGKNALRNRSNLTKATWINGQFFASAQGNTFWLKANPDTPDTNAPIYYADGVLHLRAEIVDINGSIATNIPGGASGGASTLDGYDLYVDPVNGSDLYSGTTPNSAKQTIDAAYELVTANDTTICLMPGTHASPSGDFSTKGSYPAYRVHFIAPYGPSKTVLDGGGERGFVGCAQAFTTVEGCTIRNFVCTRVNWFVFFATGFIDCVFDGDLVRRNADYKIGFEYCVFENCKMSVRNVFLQDNPSFQNGSELFYSCDAFDSVFLLSTTNSATRFAQNSFFENCFLMSDKASRFDLGGSTALGNQSGYYDSTVICQSADSIANLGAANCLIGINAAGSVPSWSAASGSAITNAETVISSISTGYRPAVTNWQFRYCGYNSASERTLRNSFLNSVLSIIAANESVPLGTRSALLAAIPQNEAGFAPSGANRDWRSCTNTYEAVVFDPDATDEDL